MQAWHAVPTDLHDIASLRRFLTYFREQARMQDDRMMRDHWIGFERLAESAIARHDDATADDLAGLQRV